MTQDKLTPGEMRIVRLVVAGRKNAQIAEELCLTVSTVRVRLTTIYEKVGVNSRVELAVMVVKKGWV